MRHGSPVIFLMMMLSVGSLQVHAQMESTPVDLMQVDPMQFYPLQTANRWVYDNIYLPAQLPGPAAATLRWRSQVEVLQRQVHSQGVVVRMGVTHAPFDTGTGISAAQSEAVRAAVARDSVYWLCLSGDTLFAPAIAYMEKFRYTEDKVTLFGREDAQVELLFPLALTRRWCSGPDSDPSRKSCRHIDTVEQIVIEADTFNQAVRRISESAHNRDTVWWSEGLGVVRSSYSDGHGGRVQSCLRSCILMPSGTDTVVARLTLDRFCLQPGESITAQLSLSNQGRTPVTILEGVEQGLVINGAAVCTWELHGGMAAAQPVRKPGFAPPQAAGSSGVPVTLQPGESRVVGRETVFVEKLFSVTGEGSYHLQCRYEYRAQGSPALSLQSNRVLFRLTKDCGATQTAASGQAGDAGASALNPAYMKYRNRYGNIGPLAPGAYAVAAYNTETASQQGSSGGTGYGSAHFSPPDQSGSMGRGLDTVPALRTEPGGGPISRNQIEEIARQVCQQQNWPFNDLRVTEDGTGNWIVITNSSQRVNNARIVINGKTGDIVERVGPQGRGAAREEEEQFQ